ncbi:uncharacterized protein DUF1835 [Paenibacillus cellulosilyticus]|uniref:Uncharacterized protein DUF1835 n=1 Tax=Paenibacillus cellulosilyticus TaxID=375489 RepID=A0A2V2YMY5_9BACL|nr:DUF1835 domain-containing protein [Paenibacillus cellulosilyticus]PWV95834.1 uncharacterized protein DUF1835 [Paenibacillus cellulosilyticus]QKS47711.1 DUF1835 domain-containing protein [Paenibacillus cellulosilyticus]
MLHIVNGDSVGNKLRKSRINGDILVWREIYSFGPVFPEMDDPELLMRAQHLERTLGIPAEEFMAGSRQQEEQLRGVHQHDDVVLWFEHDLFDQAMLGYLLHQLSKQPLGQTRLHLLCIGEFPGIEPFHGLGQLSVEQLETLEGTWRRIGEEELALGTAIWRAYASQDINDHIAIVQKDTSALPYAHAAFTRHLDRFPSAYNGLGIMEQTALELVRDGVTSPIELFRQTGDQLHELGMGDVEFGYWLRRMLRQPHALLELQGAASLPEPSLEAPLPSSQSSIVITELGHKVLAGEQNWVAFAGIDEWYGGLHLQGPIDWRWDRSKGQLRML